MLCSSCCDRSRLSTGWLIGTSLGAMLAVFVLSRLGAELHSQATIYSAFPIAMFVADSKLREQWPRLISYSVLTYGLMLALARLTDRF